MHLRSIARSEAAQIVGRELIRLDAHGAAAFLVGPASRYGLIYPLNKDILFAYVFD